MDTCFVIQPFDKDKFDLRYTDIFEPAIRAADLEPYRVDRDLSVRVPIDQIEEGIRKARICFAEVSTDNPNVWYELGYAFARGKDVVMVCSDDRVKFPFDIQHRHVTTYKTSSSSDFDELGKNITGKLKAYLQKEEKMLTLIDNPVKESEGLKAHEITMMLLLLENQITEDDSVSVFNLQTDMERVGYTKAASNLALRELKRKLFIETFKSATDYEDQYYFGCRLTQAGENWIIENQHHIDFTKPPKTNLPVANDELPF